MKRTGTVDRLFVLVLVALSVLLVLAACTPKGSGNPPPDGQKPGSFTLSGSATCTDGQPSVTLSWTAASNAQSYVVKRDGTAAGSLTTARTYTTTDGLNPGSVVRFTVIARNATGTTTSNALDLTVPDCEEEEEPDPVQATAAAVGSRHTLVVLGDGTVLGWGLGTDGALGIQQSTEIVQPMIINGLDDISDVAVGLDFSMALDSLGRVWTWGNNEQGQLGTGDTSSNPQPQQIGLPEEVKQIAAGSRFALALTAGGNVYAWGDNGQGQLGNGVRVDAAHPDPLLIPDLDDVVAISAGNGFSLALLTDGTVMGWGSNFSGQLGQDSFSSYYMSPVELSLLPPVAQIATGSDHAAVLTVEGDLYIWGDNSYGQLGNGTSGWLDSSKVPLHATWVDDVAAVVAGGDRTFVRHSDGSWSGWGNGARGGLGIAAAADYSSPVALDFAPDFTTIVTGPDTSVGLSDTNQVYAWGDGRNGGLGVEPLLTVAEPETVSGLSGVTQVASGGLHTLALTSSNQVYSWGLNVEGQLGHGDNVPRFSPELIASLSDVVSIAAGSEHSIALTADGSIFTWGRNDMGQLGTGDTDSRNAPVEIDAPEGTTRVVAAAYHSFAITDAGQIWAWGSNLESSYGNGSNGSSDTPVLVHTFPGLQDVATSWTHTLALMGDGSMRAWGFGYNGQLGQGQSGNDGNSSTPVNTLHISSATHIAVGDSFSLAVQPDALWVFGYNEHGQLGTGSQFTQRAEPAPQDASPLGSLDGIAAGARHALALQTDGSVFAWGHSVAGQVGNGEMGDEAYIVTPVRVLGDASAVFAGPGQSFAITGDGKLSAWGDNYEGQLGLGEAGYEPIPFIIRF